MSHNMQDACFDKANYRRSEVVNLAYRVEQSFLGRYYIGHTSYLTIDPCLGVYGALYNPRDSRVNVFINTFTVSNFSGTPFESQVWINSTPFGTTMASSDVSPANTAAPASPPSAVLISAQNLLEGPWDGTSLFSRLTEANSTVVGNYYGKIIIPPGGSFLIYLNPADRQIKTDIALGWWEEPVWAKP